MRAGHRLIVHANAVIGADGFSFVTPERGAVETAKSEGRVAADAGNAEYRRIHSLGAVTLGDDLSAYRAALEEGLRKLRGHHYQIVLRELETLYGHPRRLHDWARLASELAQQYA